MYRHWDAEPDSIPAQLVLKVARMLPAEMLAVAEYCLDVVEIQDDQVSRFTSDQKELFTAVSGITVTTYTMISFNGKRSEHSEKVMNEIKNREWGLLLLDEVHVVPALMFRKVGFQLPSLISFLSFSCISSTALAFGWYDEC